jgi:hypothetical protein
MAPTKTKKRPAKVQSGPPSKKILIADPSGHVASAEKLGRKRSRPVTAPLVEEDEEDEEKEDDEGDVDELVGSIDDGSDEMDMDGTKDPNGTSGSPVLSKSIIYLPMLQLLGSLTRLRRHFSLNGVPQSHTLLSSLMQSASGHRHGGRT